LSGQRLNARAIYLIFEPLYWAATQLYGKWKNALLDAGIDPAKIALQESWTRERFITRLRTRYANGEPMNSRAIMMTDAALYGAGRKLFGTWAGALAAAGFDFEELNGRASKWTRERIVDFLRKTHAAGGKVNSTAMERMGRAAIKQFGSWDAALQASGIDPTAVRLRRQAWTKHDVVLAIHQAHAAGEPLNDGAVRRNMRAAGCSLFGSWDKALLASGLDPATIRRRRPRWSKAEIIQALRKKHRNHETLKCPKTPPYSLWHAATKRFGSWRKALWAAGIGAASTPAPCAAPGGGENGERIEPPTRLRPGQPGNLV
jgi:hypothetical protein